MRRSVTTAFAVLAVLTQVVLGAITSLGVVLCVGESHAAIELASDDCCAVHGSGTHEAGIERACCSDVPLHAEASLTDAQRASHHASGFAIVASTAVAPVRDPLRRPAAFGAVPLSLGGFARRSAALRV